MKLDCNSKSCRIIKDKAFPYLYSMIASLLFHTIERRKKSETAIARVLALAIWSTQTSAVVNKPQVLIASEFAENEFVLTENDK